MEHTTGQSKTASKFASLPRTNNVTRRKFLIGAGSLLFLGAIGCSGGNTGGGGGRTTSGQARTIQHKYGSTEVSGTPERVATVGFTDQDPVLALGVTPVAVREWFGEYPSATWPWAQDELGDAGPEVLPPTELNFEQIAGLQPDLIIGVSSSMTEDEYTNLSEIAPTIPHSDEYVDFGVPWQAQTRVIGRALGRRQRAEKLVSDLESRFASVREEHPEFEGASGVVVGLTEEEQSYTPSPYGTQDLRSRFLTSLGFEIPERVTDFVGDSFSAELSRERLDLVDAEVLVWVKVIAENYESVRQDQLYQKLDAAQQGRDIFLDDLLSGAFSFGTVLSLPFLLDRLVSQLEVAVDGDPATKMESTTQ